MNEQQLQQLRERLPKNIEEAKERFSKFKSTDPFPDIFPSLLNSADIFDYVAATGMIYPFDPEKLGPATYELKLQNKCISWDEKGKKRSVVLEKGKVFVLKQNSIAFVSLESDLRIPSYIALRFNLRISNIHRGILLGTGPIVDPGFEGNLLIPLHNLTTNDYELVGGECLIKVEFTKLSHNAIWNQPSQGLQRMGPFVPFPEKAKNVDPEKYLLKASPHSPIRSSIPYALNEARQSAKTAAKRATQMTTFGFLGLVGLIFGLYNIYGQVNALVGSFYGRVETILEKSAKEEAEQHHQEINKKNEEQDKEIKDLKQQIQNLMKASSKQPKQP